MGFIVLLLHLSQDSVFLLAFLPHFARFLFLGGLGWSLRSPTPAKQGGSSSQPPCRENRSCCSSALLSSGAPAAESRRNRGGSRRVFEKGTWLCFCLLGMFTGVSKCKTELKFFLCFGSGFWKADRTERKNKVFVM